MRIKFPQVTHKLNTFEGYTTEKKKFIVALLFEVLIYSQCDYVGRSYPISIKIGPILNSFNFPKKKYYIQNSNLHRRLRKQTSLKTQNPILKNERKR